MYNQILKEIEIYLKEANSKRDRNVLREKKKRTRKRENKEEKERNKRFEEKKNVTQIVIYIQTSFTKIKNSSSY